MAEITPRWERRSFGRRFGGAEERLGLLAAIGIQESDEICLLSRVGDNIELGVDQSAKTRTTLEFVSARLKHEGKAD